jgi:hypothetical protein
LSSMGVMQIIDRLILLCYVSVNLSDIKSQHT